MASADAHLIDRTPQWHAAIDQLYDAVGREQRLAQALGAFRPFFGAQAASFFTAADAAHPSSSHTGAVGIADHLLVEYHAHYGVHDEWVHAAMRSSNFCTGAVYRGQQMVPLHQILQSYFGRNFMARHEVIDVLSGVVETAGEDGALSWMTLFRHRGEPAFTADDARRMALLVPHTRQVLRLHRRLAPQLAVGATLREMVQRLETPALFIAADGRVVDSNTAAHAALTARSAWLQARNGRLLVAVKRRWQDVSTWLSALQHGAPHSVAIDLMNDEGHCAALDVLPIQAALADTVAPHPAVAICTLKPGPRDRVQSLQSAYGLTLAEARTAVQLAQGHSAAEIAAAMRIALSTVQSHIAAVRGKLGVRRQAQIVAAVLAL